MQPSRARGIFPAGRPRKARGVFSLRADQGATCVQLNVLEGYRMNATTQRRDPKLAHVPSDATLRRERKLAKELAPLAISNPSLFKSKWERMLCLWTLEAARRGCLLHGGRRDDRKASSENTELLVFDVLKKAERLLDLCGPEAVLLVGARTRELLSNDCAKAIALAVDTNMYQMGNTANNCRLAGMGTYKKPR